MATLPERVVKLETAVGSSTTGSLMTRVQHLEVCCLGSAAAGPLPQRLDKLEETTGCTAGDGAAIAVEAALAPVADVAPAAPEVADAAASNQVRCSCFATGIHFKPGTQIQCLSKLHEVISLLS